MECPDLPLPDVLPIRPFTHPVRGGVELPGSKSITNRALLLAALGDGPVTLTGALFSEDTRIMMRALRQLGIVLVEEENKKTIRVEGRAGKIPAQRAELFVGNAGTAARFLTALCAAAPGGIFEVDGIPQMRKRPMAGLINALRAWGADIRCLGQEGFFPLEIHAGGLRGGEVRIDASESSQMLSALLMVAPLAPSGVRVKLSSPVRKPFVEMTLQLMRQFGGRIDQGEGIFQVSPGAYHLSAPDDAATQGKVYPVEPDATAASYFLALPVALAKGGRLHVSYLRRPSSTLPDLQGDLRFVTVLNHVGGGFLDIGDGMDVFRDSSSPRQGIVEDFTDFSDTFLTLAALAPLLQGRTRITGIAHTRKQETDRVAGMAKELIKLGQKVIESEDALEIHPQPLPRSDGTVEIETYGDHRFAMSFAILGCHDLHGDGRPWLSVRDPACCAKTFPDFFDRLEAVRRNSSSG